MGTDPLAIVSPERLAVLPASTVTIAESNEAPAARSTVRLPAPGPWMAMLLFRSGSGLCRSIVPVTAKPIVNLSEWLPASAVRIAAQACPGPESASELTVRLTGRALRGLRAPPAGAGRSAGAGGMARFDGGPGGSEGSAAKRERHGVSLLSRTVRDTMKTPLDPGASSRARGEWSGRWGTCSTAIARRPPRPSAPSSTNAVFDRRFSHAGEINSERAGIWRPFPAGPMPGALLGGGLLLGRRLSLGPSQRVGDVAPQLLPRLPFGLGQPGQRLRPAHAREVGVRQPVLHRLDDEPGGPCPAPVQQAAPASRSARSQSRAWRRRRARSLSSSLSASLPWPQPARAAAQAAL